MISAFDPTSGNLPPGIHAASWEEVVERFGFNERRRRLLDGLELALHQVRQAGCRRVYLDGSFVSEKAAPGDFDACWDPEGVDLPLLGLIAPVLFDLEPHRRRQKAVYGGELFPTTVIAEIVNGFVLDLFQHDKDTGLPKGVVLLELGDVP